MVNLDHNRFSKDHEWVCTGGDGEGRVGLTSYAQEMLGDIVYLDLPEVGKQLKQSEKMGEVESVKAVSEIFSPVSGEVAAVNPRVKDDPKVINDDPYGEGWILKLKMSTKGELAVLMDSNGYEQYTATLRAEKCGS